MKLAVVSIILILGLATVCNAADEQLSDEQLCFQRAQCTHPCYACTTTSNDVTLCLNATDLEHTSPSELSCVAADKPDPGPDPGPEPGPPPPPPKCSDFKTKKACVGSKEAKCSWCLNKFTPAANGTCYEEDKAKFLPPAVYDCKAPKLEEMMENDEPPAPEPPAPEPPAPEPTCGDFTTEKSCLKGKEPKDNEQDNAVDKKKKKKKGLECVWCTNKYVPGGAGQCYDPTAAKGLPAFVYKCTKEELEAMA